MIYHWGIGALSLLQMFHDLMTSNEVIDIIYIQYISSYIDNGNVSLIPVLASAQKSLVSRALDQVCVWDVFMKALTFSVLLLWHEEKSLVWDVCSVWLQLPHYCWKIDVFRINLTQTWSVLLNPPLCHVQTGWTFSRNFWFSLLTPSSGTTPSYSNNPRGKQ